jgi:hypothetical protein
MGEMVLKDPTKEKLLDLVEADIAAAERQWRLRALRVALETSKARRRKLGGDS